MHRDAWTEIWKACKKKTVEDLGTILSGLEEFRTRVLPVDQNKQKTKISYILLLKIYIVRSISKN